MKPGLAIRLVSVCGATALLVAACGGGGSTTTSSGSWSGDANRICRHLSQQEANATGFSEAALKKKVALIDAALSQLEKLSPAPNQRADYAKMLAAFRAANVYFKDNLHKIGVLAYLLDKDPSNSKIKLKLVQTIQPIEKHLKGAATIAFNLGLTQCEKGFGGGPNA